MVSVLLDKARDMIDVNEVETKSGDTPLFIACQQGHAEVRAS